MFSKFTLLLLCVVLVSFVSSLPIETKETKEEKKHEEKGDEKQENKPKVQQKSYKYSYYREYGDKDGDDKNDKGFMRRTDEGGSKGYKHFDGFEKKGGDNYEYHSHIEFNKGSGSEKDSRKDEEEKGDTDQMEVAESNNYYKFLHEWENDHGIPHFDIDWDHFFDHDHIEYDHHDHLEDDHPEHDHPEHEHPGDDHQEHDQPKDDQQEHEQPEHDQPDHSKEDHPEHDHHEDIIEDHDHHDFLHDIEFDPDPTFDHIPEHVDEEAKDDSTKGDQKEAGDHH